MDLPNARRAMRLLLASPGLALAGFWAVRRTGMAVLYKPVAWPESLVHRDLPYCDGSWDRKHRLDLFLPRTKNWPVLIFVHGGGLSSGDKALRVCGADVYGNIGRFYASQGIGVAVINYRLQPKVTWRDQVADVVRATAWVYSHAQEHGGDPSRFFISGHSAGAYLASRVALDCDALKTVGLSPAILGGVVAVSGAALDLADDRTYQLGHRLRPYECRFRCGDPTDNWRREASPITCVSPAAPPFLILYAEKEAKSLQRQSQLLHEALTRHGVASQLIVVPGQNHRRVVLTLSRPDKTAGPAILRFIAGSAQSAASADAAAA